MNQGASCPSVEPRGKNGALFNIYLQVPKGYKGAAYISLLAKKYKYQDEILFHRNMQYRIDKVEEVNGVYHLYGRVIADE